MLIEPTPGAGDHVTCCPVRGNQNGQSVEAVVTHCTPFSVMAVKCKGKRAMWSPMAVSLFGPRAEFLELLLCQAAPLLLAFLVKDLFHPRENGRVPGRAARVSERCEHVGKILVAAEVHELACARNWHGYKRARDPKPNPICGTKHQHQ